MSMTTWKTAVCAGALFAVVAWSGGAFAAVSENFEGSAVNAQFTLGTAGTVGAGVPTTPSCGFPANFDTHTKVLAITGTVTYAETAAPSTTGASQVDFMFKAEPTDELDLLSDTAVKVALAVGPAADGAAQVPVSFWCKAKGESTNSWVTLCSVANGAWVRATLVLDYDKSRCRVSIDGDPQITAAAAEDAWYAFVNADNKTYVKSITMVGSTEVDDFVVSHTALSSYAEPFAGTPVAVAETGKTISYADLNTYGITKAQAEANEDVSDGAGLKISEKLEAGLNPKSATKFEMQTMTATSATVAEVTFPGNNDAETGYEVTITSDKAGETPVANASATISKVAGAATAAGEQINKATLTLPADADRVYIHLKTKTN